MKGVRNFSFSRSAIIDIISQVIRRFFRGETYRRRELISSDHVIQVVKLCLAQP